MNDKKIAHLNMIQGVITRMGNNSFMLKGWGVGIMIAIYAFAGNGVHKAVIVTVIPIIVLWLLDSYYLLLERKFRQLYNENLKKKEEEINFSMNFNNINIKMSEISKFSFVKIMCSISVLPFYLSCIATTMIVYFIKF